MFGILVGFILVHYVNRPRGDLTALTERCKKLPRVHYDVTLYAVSDP
jgi:iron-sulfur cluster repair protein YtfE (RIC family)